MPISSTQLITLTVYCILRPFFMTTMFLCSPSEAVIHLRRVGMPGLVEQVCPTEFSWHFSRIKAVWNSGW